MKKKVGRKNDNKKIPLNLISNYALEELAEVLSFGARKYDPWNWAYGMSYSRVIAAVKRHIAQWENREEKDFDNKCKECKNNTCLNHSNRHHLGAAMCGLMFLLDYEARNMKHLDDRRPLETLRRKK